MHFTMLTVGTRGEVEPCIALGLGLQAAGHTVQIATHPNFESSIHEAGLDFALIDFDLEAWLASESFRAIVEESRRNPVRALRIAIRTTRSMLKQIGDDCWTACQGTDVVMYTVGGFFFAPHIAERLDLPCIGTYPYPMGTPTGSFPNIFSPSQRNLGRGVNRFTHTMNDVMSWMPLRKTINRWRDEQLDLPPVKGSFPRHYRERGDLMLYGFSPSIVPKPPDWGDQCVITGTWFMPPDEDFEPPPALLDFLEAGPPPVFVGFGSTNDRDLAETANLVLAALKQSGQRGVFLSSEHYPDDLPDNLFVIEPTPFGWLFPRMAVVVHHGGSGTTALGLKAGVPTVVIPSFMDQPFWGQRVADLGVGPSPIPRNRLSVDRLSAAIRQAADNLSMRERATALGEQIRKEDGVARAVEEIANYLG
jgi:sterol 3beta-glucosyltransferase